MVELKICRWLTNTLLISGIILTIWPKLQFGIGIFIIIYAAYAKSKSVKISKSEVYYQSWFIKKSIKKIESVDIVDFFIFNHITITGNGGSRIQIANVNNISIVKKLSENL